MEATLASTLSARLVGILWGDAKTGKTTYACSLPGRKLLINFGATLLNFSYFSLADLSSLNLAAPFHHLSQ